MISYMYSRLCYTSLFDVVPAPDGSALSYGKKMSYCENRPLEGVWEGDFLITRLGLFKTGLR